MSRTRTGFGKRGFQYSGPAAWNSQRADLHDITDTNTFKKRLKTVRFDRVYTDVLLLLSGAPAWTVRIAAPIVLYWLSGNTLTSINVVALYVGPVSSTGMGDRWRVAYTMFVFNQATQVYSAWPSLRG